MLSFVGTQRSPGQKAGAITQLKAFAGIKPNVQTVSVASKFNENGVTAMKASEVKNSALLNHGMNTVTAAFAQQNEMFKALEEARTNARRITCIAYFS